MWATTTARKRDRPPHCCCCCSVARSPPVFGAATTRVVSAPPGRVAASSAGSALPSSATARFDTPTGRFDSPRRHRHRAGGGSPWPGHRAPETSTTMAEGPNDPSLNGPWPHPLHAGPVASVHCSNRSNRVSGPASCHRRPTTVALGGARRPTCSSAPPGERPLSRRRPH